MTKVFYKDAVAAIMVYDIARKDSFEAIKSYWYPAISENAQKNISKVVVY
jgi:GTPase SAR1 family protein